jgi:hypothetical protein
VNSRIHQDSKNGPQKGSRADLGPIAGAAHGFLVSSQLSFPFLPNPDRGLTFPLLFYL